MHTAKWKGNSQINGKCMCISMLYKYKTLANTNWQNDTEMCGKLGYTKQFTHSMQCDNIQQYTHKWYINYCVCSSMLAVCSSDGHLLVLISPTRAESSMLRKASTRVAQVTGCLPLPVSHSLRISMFIWTGLFKFLCAIILTFDPVLSSRRKMPKRTYLVAISTGMLTTLPSVHVNFSSSGRVGLGPGMSVLCGKVGKMCAYQTPYLTAVQRNDTLGSH